MVKPFEVGVEGDERIYSEFIASTSISGKRHYKLLTMLGRMSNSTADMESSVLRAVNLQLQDTNFAHVWVWVPEGVGEPPRPLQYFNNLVKP